MIASLAESGVEAARARRALAARAAGVDRPRRPDRGGGPGAGRGRRTDPAEPRLGRRRRGARPAARRARPRPLRRAGDQDRPDRRADGGPRRDDLGRARRGAGGRSRRPGAAPRPARGDRDRDRRRRDGRRQRAASTGSSSTRPARTSAPSPRAPTPAGASRRARSSAWSRSRTGSCARRRGMLRPGGVLVYSTCTISRRENEDRVAALLAASAAGELPALAAEDLGERAPGLASPVDSALPAAAPRPRPHDRILHRPPETG